MTTPALHRSRRGCIDRIVAPELDVEARAIALVENPANAGETDGSLQERLARVTRKMWRPGRTLRIQFLDGTPFLRARVERYAGEWTRHANLRFEFGSHSRAEIRISFLSDPGSSWSALGTDALVGLYYPRHQPTMSFGWLDDDTPEEELARVIMHEFGHAIGCIHEHPHPAGGIAWDEAAVIAHFSGPPNHWDEAAIRRNVIDRYSSQQLNGPTFDPDSIMRYALPEHLARTGAGTRENGVLSAGDIELVQRAYPRA